MCDAASAAKDEVCTARMSAALSGYLHITSNYITVRLVRNNPERQYEAENPQTSVAKAMRGWHAAMVNII